MFHCFLLTLQITVNIVEPQGISFVNANGGFMTNELMDTVQIDHNGNNVTYLFSGFACTREVRGGLTMFILQAYVVFKPTLKQQRKCPSCMETLLDGDFVVKYDVNRETSAGNLQVTSRSGWPVSEWFALPTHKGIFLRIGHHCLIWSDLPYPHQSAGWQ